MRGYLETQISKGGIFKHCIYPWERVTYCWVLSQSTCELDNSRKNVREDFFQRGFNHIVIEYQTLSNGPGLFIIELSDLASCSDRCVTVHHSLIFLRNRLFLLSPRLSRGPLIFFALSHIWMNQQLLFRKKDTVLSIETSDSIIFFFFSLPESAYACSFSKISLFIIRYLSNWLLFRCWGVYFGIK